MALPLPFGNLLLERLIGLDGISEAYHGLAGLRPVKIRRILPEIVADPLRLKEVEDRVDDLRALRHDFLLPVIDYVVHGNERLVVEERPTGISLEDVLEFCRQRGTKIPQSGSPAAS